MDLQIQALDASRDDPEFDGDRTRYGYDARGNPHSLYHGPVTLEQWVRWARRWVRQDRHLPIGIVGPPGNGKTGFRTLLARKLQPDYDPWKQTTFGELNTVRLAKQVPRYGVACGDEGDESGNKLRTMGGKAVEVAEEMDHIRKLNTIPIFTRPDYADFIKGLADHFHWVFDITRRGWFCAYESFSLGVKKKTTLLAGRFEGPFPDCAKVWPEGWEAVMELGGKYAGDVDPVATREYESTVQAFRRVIRSVVQ